MTAYAKGSVAKSGHDFIRRRFGEEAWTQAVGSLSEEDRRVVAVVDKSPQYPIAVDGRIFAELSRSCFGGDVRRTGEAFREIGRSQAEDMLNGVFSVFARFVSPKAAFDRAGSIIASAYTGVTSETHAGADGKSGVITIRGLGELTYGAPSIAGWIESALRRFGAKDARVTERNWEAGRTASDELVFDLRWE